MKLLVDMNLSPEFVNLLVAEGWEAVHWSQVGDPRAEDSQIMTWAKERDFIVITHDLDFGNLLAVIHAQKPSVLQVRTQDVSPNALGGTLIAALKQFSNELTAGALVTVDKARRRARVLPIG